MCGRFSLGVDTDRLISEFDVDVVTIEHRPRYNIAPTQPVAAVVRDAGDLRLGSLRWGLVPAGPAPPPGGRPIINARSETVARKPAFADSFRRRRCWILADGFYEWREESRGKRAAFHIRLPEGRPFAFAGIWDRAGGEGDDPLLTGAILTTRPAGAIAGIHDRMPVILPSDIRAAWLDPTASPASLAALLRPFEGGLEVHRVSSRVNSAANDDPSCRAPAEDATETSSH
ncbi:MAG TPA: SOS response-associated peptidase [Longimicrobiales bacterium]|nr:SOS response-associated peptidase [Longimicrobiales bacterium]